MPNYDASIRINTRVDTSQMQKLQIQVDKTTDKVSRLSAKYDELRNKKVPTAEYAEISAQIAQATTEFDRLIAKQDQMIALGKTSGSAWDSLQYKMEETGNTIRYAKGELQDLVERGKAFTVPASDEVKKMASDLSYAQAELRALNTKQGELYAKQIKSENGVKKVTKEYKNLKKTGSDTLDTIGRKTNKSAGLFSTMATRLKGIALSLLIFNWISKGFNAMVRAMQEGFKNLSGYSNEYNKNMSELKSQSETLKNGLAAAFEPIANIIVPYLSQLVSWVNTATASISKFFAILGGKSTYTVAKKQVVDYAKSLDNASDSASRALAAFDDLNVLDSESSGGGGGGASGGSLFEEVKVGEVSSFMQTLKDAIEQGDWYTVGASMATKLNETVEKTDWKGLGKKAGEKVNDFIDGANGFLDNYDAKGTGEAITDTITGFVDEVDWKTAGDTAAKAFQEAFKTSFWVVFNIGEWIYEKLTGEEMDQSLEDAADDVIESFFNGTLNGEKLKKLWDELFKTGTKFAKETIIKWGFQLGEMAMSAIITAGVNSLKALAWISGNVFKWGRSILDSALNFSKKLIDVFVQTAIRIAEIAVEIAASIASAFGAADTITPNIGKTKTGNNNLKMATGGITTRPVRALIGEAGQEAVLPLENNTEWMDMLAERIGSGGVTIKFDGSLSQLVKILKPALDEESIRIGRSLTVST